MADGDRLPAEARAGRGKYVTWSPELETAILERVAGGESVLAVCRGEDMPHPTTVYAWGHERPGFAAALAEAQRTARVAQRLADRAAAAAKFARGRDPRGRWSTYTPEMGEEICRRICDGETLASVGRDPEMPCAGTILRWAREFPEFGDRYTLARQMLAEWLFDEAREVSLAATPTTVWAERLRFDTIRWMTARMAPRKYCERVVAETEAADRRLADDPERRPMTVVVRRFTDAPDPEAGEYPEID